MKPFKANTPPSIKHPNMLSYNITFPAHEFRMSSPLRYLIPFICLILCSPLMAEPLNIVTSILPQKTFVEAIGGEHVKVTTMVMPGQSPATYEPTPKQMATLARANLYYRIGVAFENTWMDTIAARYPDMVILDARDGLKLRSMTVSHQHSHDQGHDHGHSHTHTKHSAGNKDPHTWLNPKMVITMAGKLKDQLSQLDPDNAAAYAKNHALFVARLAQLDTDLRTTLEPLKFRKIMVFHPSWGYFTDAYGLTQIAIEQEGKAPGARSLNRLISQAKKQGVHVIFAQKQFTTRYAATIAKAIEGTVVTIDPLSPDYFSNLQHVADAIVEAQP